MISEEQWDKIRSQLSMPWGRVTLMVDGFELGIEVREYKALRLAICVFVNGRWKWAWKDLESEEVRRFANKQSRYVHGTKFRKRYKRLSKRSREEFGIDPDAKWFFYHPAWFSFDKLKRHLIKNNTELSVKKIGFEEVAESLAGVLPEKKMVDNGAHDQAQDKKDS